MTRLRCATARQENDEGSPNAQMTKRPAIVGRRFSPPFLFCWRPKWPPYNPKSTVIKARLRVRSCPGDFFDRALKLFCGDRLGEVKEESSFHTDGRRASGVEPSHDNSQRRPRRLTYFTHQI